ncbi:MAG: excisionase family DNA-binding protein [Chloroflexia bacterium]|nr:excisionase family DNA-binding protein [Chloroflexia bacterium]
MNGSGASTARTASATITVAEAAAQLGLNERTVRRAIRRGDIEARKRGRGFHLSQDSVDAYAVRERTHPRRRALRIALTLPPAPLTSFVGREALIATLTRLMQQGTPRLFTLTGPGGVGKTRLALQLLAGCAASFPDGAVFVPLAAIREPGLVLPTIAQAFGVPLLDEQAAGEQLRQILAKARLLLVLDNLEQAPGAGPGLADLVAACPGLVLLVTSRVRLRVAGEHAHVVPPLNMPTWHYGRDDDFGRDALRALGRAEAVRLFVERAGDSVPGFALSAENAADVAEICRRLDGLPLALELAAARLRHMHLGDLCNQLDRALPLLAGGPRDAPERFQSMRDALAWSYTLLSPREQAVICWLSVFIGGFSREAAEAIAGRALNRATDCAGAGGDRPPEHGSMFALLSSLIDQSFIQMAPPTEALSGLAGTRYVMFEVVREYGLEQLAARGEEALARDAHATWCLELASRAREHLMEPVQESWFTYLGIEQANIRAALAWLLELQDSWRGLTLIEALTWFWTSRGYLHEAAQVLANFLTMPGATSHPAHADLLLQAANIAHWQKDFAVATRHSEAALALFRANGNVLSIGWALRQQGSVAIDDGRLDAAAALLAESQSILLEHGAPWDKAFVPYLQGRLAVARQQWALADHLFVAAATAFEAIRDFEYVAAARCRQAAALLRRGDGEQARAAYREGLALAQKLELPYWMGWGLSGAAALSAQARQPARAARLLGEALRLVAAAGFGTLDDGVAEAVMAQLGVPVPAPRLTARAGVSKRVLAEAVAVLQPDGGSADLHEPGRIDGLSPREREVLALLARGYTDKEIATALQIARYTAINHVAAIRQKLGVPSRAAAAALAALAGALDEPADREQLPPVHGTPPLHNRS